MFMNALGTFSYNGYEFDGSSKITVSCEMVRDEAARTIIYQKHTYTVHATVADNTDTGTTMDDIKAKLGEAGQKLIVIDRGFGLPLVIGGNAALKDLKSGPMPQVLEWEPIGANLACEIVWQVVVCIPYCDNTGFRRSGILAFNYDVQFSIRNGDTRRTISGYVEINQTRAVRSALNCADVKRDLLNAPLPNGFTRETDFNISKDKSRLDFTITDTQIPSKFPYPVGCTNASGSHDVAWTRNNRGATRLRNTISMELEMAPGFSQAQAWSIFGNIVAQRIGWARRQGLPVLLDELRVREDIWGRSTSFAVSYQILRSCAACLPQHAGLWQPINADWTRWKASMSNVFDVRGTAKLRQAGGDAIIDLCGPETSSVGVQGYQNSQPDGAPKYGSVFKNSYPDPKESYIKFDNAIIPSRDRPVQRQSFLQTPESSPGLIGSEPEDASPFSFGTRGGTSDVIQEGGRGRYDVTMIGSAIRAGFQVPRPSLESVGSQTAVETYIKMAQMVVGNWFGVPIFQAIWTANYALGNAPEKVNVEKNPKESVDDNGKSYCKC